MCLFKGFISLLLLSVSLNCYAKEVIVTTQDKVTIWSEASGDKKNPAILLVMGAMNQSVLWSDSFQHALVESGFYVIRYDHRDTGRSSGVDFQQAPYNLNTLKEDALAVLAAHDVKQATVVGLSMGGYIAQLLAAEHPESVSKLVLISSSADHRPYMNAIMGQPQQAGLLPPPNQSFLSYVMESIQSPPTTKEAISKNVLEGWRVTYAGDKPFPKADISAALALSEKRAGENVTPMNHALATAASPDRLELVKKIAAPTLVIHGQYDPCLPLAHGQYLADNIPNARLKVLAMGHSFQWAWDSEVAAEIVGFVR